MSTSPTSSPFQSAKKIQSKPTGTNLLGNQRISVISSKSSPIKNQKFARATVSVDKVDPKYTRTRSFAQSIHGVENLEKKVMKRKLPRFKAPEEPPAVEVENFILTKVEHNLILSTLKKFYNANKQLLAVARTAAAKVVTLQNSSKVEFMIAQLQLARDELSIANSAYTNSVREATIHFSHCDTIKVAHLTIDAANYTSLICAGIKSVAMEFKKDDSVLLPVLTSIVTARDSLVSIIEAFEKVKNKIDRKLSVELTTYIKNLSLLITALVACRSGKLIPLGRKLELEAAASAATCSIVKLVTSFSRPIEQSIVYETKIASACISQLWATLNELSSSPNMLSIKQVKQKVTYFLSELKSRFAIFMEETKKEVSHPSLNSLEVMKENVSPLKELLLDIVAHINSFAEIDTSISITEDLDFTPSETHLSRANDVTADPDNLVPPPPSTRQAQHIDLPDDAVEDINPIWDEPEIENGRVLYTDNNTIRAATLNKLLIHLTENLDVTYLKTFVTTYRSFTTPEIFIQKISQRYNVPDKYSENRLPIQLRCANIVKQWVETSFYDFDETVLEKLCIFLEELNKDSRFSKFSTAIGASITKKQEDREKTTHEIVNLTIEEKIPLSPANLLFIFPEEEIARQITLVDFIIYQSIQPAELLNQAWSKAKYRHRAKNVLNMISRSTLLTMWVSSVIVWQDTLKGRIKALTKFINIAQFLRKLNNFNSLMAVLAGISTSAVYRLKFTRAGLTPKSKATLDDLNDLMDAGQSYATYRHTLHDVNPPCVPFLGTYLTDITFIEDGNPDFIQGLINYRKRELVYSVIREIQQYQQKSYSFPMVDGIAHYLSELPNNSEEVLYTLSLEREPRNTKSADELI